MRVSAKRLREILKYDRATGLFTYRITRGPNKAGCVAGRICEGGYCRIVMDGKEYKASRLAWLYVHGVWPTKHIDHKDGVTHNNKFRNLRQATRSQNLANSRLRKDNVSGFKGVCLEPSTGKWMANVNKDGKRYYLGLFPTPERAHREYRKAARKLHGKFCRYF